jgi:ribonucleoside-diphosphate reductase alpha chain
MGRKAKLVITDEGQVDLATHEWDDRRFSDILLQANTVDSDQALEISRFLRRQIEKMEFSSIPLSIIEQMVTAKLPEFGISDAKPIHLDPSIFIKNGLMLSDNARTVLERRYLKKSADGELLETPAKMFRRVARHIAASEATYGGEERVREAEKVFYDMMSELKFLPNSPTLMNAGRRLGQLAACFVLPVADSMEGIFDSLKNAAMIHKSGGGTGFSFSRLRPKHSRVGTTGGVASGPVSFMRIFNTATEQVKQGGTRRGANMAILRVDHPDILEFIACKSEASELNNFNISVGITEEFMKALAENKDYALFDPYLKEVIGHLNAKTVYDTLVENAWKSGDPGIIFLDRINRDNPTPALGEIESTNPCGEQPLLPMEACNLGSINLAKFVRQEDEKAPKIDYDGLREMVVESVRFLDDTIDAAKYPLPQIDEMVRGNRKIGLGVMGFADMLYQLKVPYNSETAIALAQEVMAFIQESAKGASQSLAMERGTFPNFDKSVFKDTPDIAYRNATVTTIAPTGTLSIIANCSSGIEPLFALSFVRTVMDNDRLVEINPWFEKAAKEQGFYSEELMREIAETGTLHGMDQVPEEVRRVFVTAHDVAPEWHIRMQAAFQKFTDNAVSKTVNLPREATIADVKKIYDLAYELGCKGVTIYRDGSKENQVLSVSKKEESQEDKFLTAVKKRPETLDGFTTRIKTGMGQLYVTVTEYDGRPFEVFATIGKSGRSTTAKTEAIGRLVSLALRSGVRVEKIVEQLKGIGGEHPVFQQDGLVLSIPDAISRVLEKRYLNGDGAPRTKSVGNSLSGQKCPECGEPISYEEGCLTCHYCGFSKCG